MMCRVVQDVQLPLFKFAPVEPLLLVDTLEKQKRPHNPSNLIPNILPEASLTTNRKDFLSAITDKSLTAKISKIFDLDGGLNNEERVNFETKEVRRYALSNAGEYFKKLMGDELYERDVRALLKETSGRAYLVVGFLTTSNAKWEQDRSDLSTYELTGAVPVTAIAAAAGAPLPVSLDPSFSAKNNATHTSNRSHESPDEEIFAIAYAPVKTSIFDFRKKKKVVIGRAKSASANHLAFSHFDDDNDDNDDDDSNDDAPARNSGDGEIQLGEDDVDWAESLEEEGFEF